MDELLQALKEGDESRINTLAKNLFSTSHGRLDRGQVNEFEKYAPCKIMVCDQIIIALTYNDHTYFF
jgi:hypothetical protein